MLRGQLETVSKQTRTMYEKTKLLKEQDGDIQHRLDITKAQLVQAEMSSKHNKNAEMDGLSAWDAEKSMREAREIELRHAMCHIQSLEDSLQQANMKCQQAGGRLSELENAYNGMKQERRG